MYKIRFSRIHNGAEYYIEIPEDQFDIIEGTSADDALKAHVETWKRIVDTMVKEDSTELIINDQRE